MGCRGRDQIGGDLGGAARGRRTEARRVAHPRRVGPRETARIVRTAEGNPLFLEQLVATGEERGDTANLPPTIQAVLATRIAGLDPAERTVLERASVAGRNFTGSLVAALLSEGERRTLGEHLMTLVRRQLIQPTLLPCRLGTHSDSRTC